MVDEIKPGDRIRVTVVEGSFEGVLMPRPKLSPEDVITIKLDSGYNVGVKKSEDLRIEILKKYDAPLKKKPKDPVIDPTKRTVSILSTGGTIASRVDYATGGVSASFTASELLESMPEITDYANIRASQVMNIMSEDMNPKLWAQLAKSIADEFNTGADGVVVTHGTDTMHYSSAAMSFMLSDLQKPVVFTGAQRSSDRGSADSFLNLSCSVAFAASDYDGVYLCMHGGLDDTFCLAHKGTKVRKMHTTRRDAFKSINSSPAAKIQSDGGIQSLIPDLPKRGDANPRLQTALEEDVGILRVYPGMKPDILEYYLQKGYKGLIIEGTALGHVPTTIAETSLIPGIKALIKNDVVVGMTTQCLFGAVNPHVYSNLRELFSQGVIYLNDMLPETAYVKLMWVLGNSKTSQESRELMASNIALEYNEKTPIDDFNL
jgi:glutamyl-tRNA(Gln) amidotransferase subunit D